MRKKVFFTFKPKGGSFGGGSFFVTNMIEYLKNRGCKITYTLETGIDIIFITDPRKGKKGSSKSYYIDDIIQYKKRNPKVKILHRINECETKREKSIGIDQLLLKTMKIADRIVFITQWLQDYFVKKYNISTKNCSVVVNGCNPNFFFPPNKNQEKVIEERTKVKLITHHWSSNYLKGFEIYNKIDEYLGKHSDDFELTFVGNYNENYKPKNITVLPPECDLRLGNILREHDIYLTASQNEPCGMHQLEGMSCGMPILYRQGSGGIKETCGNAGLEFSDFNDFLEKLQNVKKDYDIFKNNINYGWLSSNRCCKNFYKIIKNL